MKKITLLISLLFASNAYCQIPSIKQAKRKVPVAVQRSPESPDEMKLLLDIMTKLEPENADVQALLTRYNSKKVVSIEGLENEFRFLRIKHAELETKMDDLRIKQEDVYARMERDGINNANKEELAKVTFSIDSLQTEIKNNDAKISTQHPGGLFPTISRKKLKKGKGGEGKSVRKRKEEFFAMLYSKKNDRDFYFVNNAALQVSDDANSVQSEITSAYMGGFRLALGTMLSNSGSSEESEGEPEPEGATDEQAFQRLLSGGGNVYLNVELPVFFAQEGPFVAYLNGYAKGAVDFSQISNDIDTSTANGSLGLNFYTSLSTDENEFNFFANASYAMYYGGNEFYKALSVEESFNFGQLTVGMTVFNKFRFSVTTNTWGSEDHFNSGKIVFGIQILSGLFEE